MESSSATFFCPSRRPYSVHTRAWNVISSRIFSLYWIVLASGASRIFPRVQEVITIRGLYKNIAPLLYRGGKKTKELYESKKLQQSCNVRLPRVYGSCAMGFLYFYCFFYHHRALFSLIYSILRWTTFLLFRMWYCFLLLRRTYTVAMLLVCQFFSAV